MSTVNLWSSTAWNPARAVLSQEQHLLQQYLCHLSTSVSHHPVKRFYKGIGLDQGRLRNTRPPRKTFQAGSTEKSYSAWMFQPARLR